MTPRQQQYAEAVKQYGSARKAAAALGVHHAVISRALKGRAQEVVRAGKRILVLPDVQAKPGTDFSYLSRIGQYAVDKRPDIIVCIGDFADMPSLSSYDKGKKSFEGRRYRRDVEAAQFAMQAFLKPIDDWNATHPGRPYKPRKVLTLGNHEHRTTRACEDDPKLDGVLSLKDLAYEEYGWEVYPFLQVVVIEGVAFSHFFTTGTMGRPVTTAQAALTKKHMSVVQGHQQGLQIATGYRGDGQLLTSIIAGSCYEHDEAYLGPQGNKHWRGFLMLHAVKDGSFDLMPVSLEYINGRYPNIRYETPAYSLPTEAEMQAGRM